MMPCPPTKGGDDGEVTMTAASCNGMAKMDVCINTCRSHVDTKIEFYLSLPWEMAFSDA